MKSMIGDKIKMSVFGESHGVAIGAVIEGLPAGKKIDLESLAAQMERRAPGRDCIATPRKEADTPEILSGVLDGVTTGAPLALIIRNTNAISKDYSDISALPRPSHSDYAAYVKYGGFNDVRGGGHFSGRLTAPIVAVGSVCRDILKEAGVTVGGHILKIGSAEDRPFDPVNVTSEELEELSTHSFSVIDEKAESTMRAEIELARAEGDSVGGIVELAVTGLPAGVGNPMFSGVENVISKILYGIPAVKAVAFGAGFDFGSMRGSNANDSMTYVDGKVVCTTNNCGGITGGITNGMPVIIKVALKPTPSIAAAQKTVNLETQTEEELHIHGRHDPCIVPRALVALEAALSIAVLDLLSEDGKI